MIDLINTYEESKQLFKGVKTRKVLNKFSNYSNNQAGMPEDGFV
jgi:hypothetical protein